MSIAHTAVRLGYSLSDSQGFKDSCYQQSLLAVVIQLSFNLGPFTVEIH